MVATLQRLKATSSYYSMSVVFGMYQTYGVQSRVAQLPFMVFTHLTKPTQAVALFARTKHYLLSQ